MCRLLLLQNVCRCEHILTMDGPLTVGSGDLALKKEPLRLRSTAGKWSEGSETLRQELSWPLLSTRRSFQKLSLCRRILNGHSLIPDTVFPPNTSSHLRHPNSRPLNRPFARTNYHKHSFFVSVIELWKRSQRTLSLQRQFRPSKGT